MIQRVVLVQFRDEYRSDSNRLLVAAHTRQVLSGIPLVRDLEVGVPAEARTEREWDLVILARFENLEAIEKYRTERTHRAYADIYLSPMKKKIRVFHFALDAERLPPSRPPIRRTR